MGLLRKEGGGEVVEVRPAQLTAVRFGSDNGDVSLATHCLIQLLFSETTSGEVVIDLEDTKILYHCLKEFFALHPNLEE